jgi:hypothetical protein
MIMNLKETIISSFFFHLILLLLMIAVSSHTTGFSGAVPNSISVDLTGADNKDLPAAGTDSAEAPPPASTRPADEDAGVSVQTLHKPVEEPAKIPEPEKKADALTESAKSENAEKSPARTGGFTSLEAYHQFIMIHKEIFTRKAEAKVKDLIGEALKENTRDFFGGTAVISLKYGADGKLSGVRVDSASPELKAFLEGIDWVDLPAPAAYVPGYTAVQIEFAVLEGYLSFKVRTL